MTRVLKGVDSISRVGSKNILGRYYTPEQATRILCLWAIRRSEEKVLEPSFGACGFLEAASNRLKGALGAVERKKAVCTAVISMRGAFISYLEPKLGIDRDNPHFLYRDHLQASLSSLGRRE